MAQQDIKNEMDEVINQLEKKGVRYNQGDETTGLGDVVESVLTSMGITQERFKEWFNLKECNCSKRKQWLNNLFSWKKSKE
tara:strand:- start:489 stop:731 length:243 start_codon:yes stop_codon:yes gene_type:complete